VKVWSADDTLAALKCKLRESEEAHNDHMVAFTRGCLMIMQGMPTIDVMDGIECGKCFFYDAEHKRCIHKNGLGGRIRKGMYCSYGSFHADDIEDEEDEDEFGEFDD